MAIKKQANPGKGAPQGEKGNILVICAHSDDQILGPGGAMAKYAREGYNVYTMICSYGESSHPHMKLSYIARIRVMEAKEADSIIAGKGVMFLALKDFAIADDFKKKKMMERFKRQILSYAPRKIFTHSGDDIHPDHRFVKDAVLEACDGLARKNLLDAEVYTFDVSNIFNKKEKNYPRLVVDISSTFKYKIKALHEFRSQINFFSYMVTVNILYLAVYYRAFMNGLKYGFRAAEVFRRIR
jgi:LmbE family N-acetylglucosaminyl deacetylase